MKTFALLATSALAFIATFVVLGAFAPDAYADATVSCTVVEIEATTSDAPSVSPELRPLEKKLKKPPFSSWNTFKQLGSHAVTLETMKSNTLTLTHGKAGLLLREVTAGGQKKTRISLAITVDDADGKRKLDTKVAVDAGDYLVVGRSLKGNRGHLLAMNCKQ
jgi:hypothetical protein